ncbi:hypothetical protein QGM71_00305 [Virgibacillus sp. C22-A2]|uniref:Type 4 fimbrial biogenesis protein PilX N-terminal domain-containing protein n=1 Tax=Virgibacillus tibetensis TaxID=3042313 RepID=A0ABU6K984_9BACI|nr:hypothetical protein [Virgibacillus sp. C22-A2]
MKIYRNEKGAALVLTMMIITLFLVFIMAQFTQIINTTRQVTTMEENIDARLIAGMGIDYVEVILNEFSRSELPLNEYLQNEIPEGPVEIGSTDRTYEISFEEFIVDDRPESISYKSIGKAFGAHVVIESQITINWE